MKENFPYTVEEKFLELNDEQCCNTRMPDGWHTERCNRKAKEIIDGIKFCRICARSIKIWRIK